MQYTCRYESPLGEIVLAADNVGLTGLCFAGQKYFASHIDKENREKNLSVFNNAKKWLDIYFSGREPDFQLPLHFTGSDFQNHVWKILCQIPYGKTTTYGAIAARIARDKNLDRMSAQAVGGAIARNKISVIVPCHRVVGAGGGLTGYAGGIDRKMALLKIENCFQDDFSIPKLNTVL